MPTRTDTTPRLSGSRLCEISGVLRQTRDKWAGRGLVRAADHYDELDIVELVVLKSLFDSLKKSHVRIAWSQVRAELRGLVPGPTLSLVWDPQHRVAKLAFDDATIVTLVRHGRPVHVLDLGPSVKRARDAFRREVSAELPAASLAQPRRKARGRGRGDPA